MSKTRTRKKLLRKKSTRRRNRGGEDKKKSRRRRTPAPHKPAPKKSTPKTLKSPPKPRVPSPSALPLQEFPAFKRVNRRTLARSMASKLSDDDKKLLSKRNEELAKKKFQILESKSAKATRDIKQMLGMK